MGQPKSAKAKASDRTISFLTGLTNEEAKLNTDVEEAPDPEDKPKSIEEAAEKWRANAFFTAEHFSKHFNEGKEGKEVFRLTEKDGHMFLEKMTCGDSGKAYHWCGVMFRTENLGELGELFYRVAKEKKNASGTR